MAYEIVDWVIESGKVDYGNVLGNSQKVSRGMQAVGDKRIDTWMSKSDYLNVKSDSTGRSLSGEIETTNQEWIGTFRTDIETVRDEDDLGTIKTRFDAQKGNYEEESVTEVQTMIDEVVVPTIELPPEEVLRPTQAALAADVLGLPEEDVRDMGVRAVQQALEGDLLDRISTADSDAELDEILADTDAMPTKAGARRIRQEVRAARAELETEE